MKPATEAGPKPVAQRRAESLSRPRTQSRRAPLKNYDAIIISGDHGDRKPDARLFRKALEIFHVSPEQPLVVGNDRYRDLLGAQPGGMKLVWLCSNPGMNRSHQAEPGYNLSILRATAGKPLLCGSVASAKARSDRP